MELEVLCSVVGAGWARSAPGGRVEYHADHEDVAALSRAVADALRHGRPTALGFACPLSVPVPTNELALGRARVGEGNRPWSASDALGPGLAQLAWVLRAVRERAPLVEYHPDWHVFRGAGRGLFLWEALGTDPRAAVRAFSAALPDPTRSNALGAPRPISLAGAAALWAGLTADLRVLGGGGLAVRAA